MTPYGSPMIIEISEDRPPPSLEKRLERLSPRVLICSRPFSTRDLYHLSVDLARTLLQEKGRPTLLILRRRYVTWRHIPCFTLGGREGCLFTSLFLLHRCYVTWRCIPCFTLSVLICVDLVLFPGRKFRSLCLSMLVKVMRQMASSLCTSSSHNDVNNTGVSREFREYFSHFQVEVDVKHHLMWGLSIKNGAIILVFTPIKSGCHYNQSQPRHVSRCCQHR